MIEDSVFRRQESHELPRCTGRMPSLDAVRSVDACYIATKTSGSDGGCI
jgi:hypothetical protein